MASAVCARDRGPTLKPWTQRLCCRVSGFCQPALGALLKVLCSISKAVTSSGRIVSTSLTKAHSWWTIRLVAANKKLRVLSDVSWTWFLGFGSRYPRHPRSLSGLPCSIDRACGIILVESAGSRPKIQEQVIWLPELQVWKPFPMQVTSRLSKIDGYLFWSETYQAFEILSTEAGRQHFPLKSDEKGR